MTDDGGLRGVRAWAEAALGRAELVLLPDPNGPFRLQLSNPAAEDELIAELNDLVRLLERDEVLWPVLAARLGGLLAIRQQQRPGTPGDRSRALHLLRAARADGAGLSRWDRQRAALYLYTLLIPLPHGDPREAVSDFGGLAEWGRRYATVLSPDSPAHDELGDLLAELDEAPLPPQLRRQLGVMSAALRTAPPGPDEMVAQLKTMFDLLPPGFPIAEQLRTLLSTGPLRTAPTGGTPSGPADPTVPTTGQQEPEATLLDLLAPVLRGDARADQLAALAELAGTAQRSAGPEAAPFGALIHAMAQVAQVRQPGDLQQLADAAESVRQEADRVSPTNGWLPALGTMLSTLIGGSHSLTGSLQDAAAAEEQLAKGIEQLQGSPLNSPEHPLADLAGIFRAVLLGRRHAREGNADGLRECIATIVAIRDTLAKDDDKAAAAMMLGVLNGELWRITNDPEAGRRTIRLLSEIEQAQSIVPHLASVLGSGSLRTQIASLQALIDGNPEELREALAAPAAERSGASPGTWWGRTSEAMAHGLLAGLTDDPADLHHAIEALEQVRPDPARGDSSWPDGMLLWDLAQLYRRRDAQDSGDQAPATQAMIQSLEATAAAVLLESDAEHRLQQARDGAARAVQGAWWSGANGRAEHAITMLELGRSMVLQAAAVSARVPERLAAAGHPELARQWRAAEQSDAQKAAVPSRLRGQALAALGYRAGSGPFKPPPLPEIRSALRSADADALVYLVPGGATEHGLAVILGPDIEPCALSLPQLGRAGRDPLDAYVDVCAERSRLREDDPDGRLAEAEARWEQALTELCGWAWPAAVRPMIQGIAEKLAEVPGWPGDRPDGPPRLVLVPCGNLGVVPWHAARLPEGGEQRYVCELMVLSYAASGREFLRSAARRRLAPASRPVLLADPRMDLTWAEQEVLALRDSCYPSAELYGEYYELTDEPVAIGTPEEVLALLPGGGRAAERPPSLLHVASHGSAGVRPTVSALYLADLARAEPADGPDGPDGPDAGQLTVARLLERPAPSEPAAPGPLVVLSACETDLSTRDHDEALTLATAFLAAGATDVVGSRWATRDATSALMMAVFHHHLAVRGLTPAHALRAAQQWMLDPHRVPPPGLSPELLRQAGEPQLAEPAVWAAFVHHGRPGPAPRPAATEPPM
ncbi:CHAT domain-containing protein [Kitasatospora sp. NPDC008050]|uniref:CHAT domain-containing protein n=1 Tax=Kitasatospora sp. NPDC008050 TaxID=3364021 RepID=UPI0036EC4BC1